MYLPSLSPLLIQKLKYKLRLCLTITIKLGKHGLTQGSDLYTLCEKSGFKQIRASIAPQKHHQGTVLFLPCPIILRMTDTPLALSSDSSQKEREAKEAEPANLSLNLIH